VHGPTQEYSVIGRRSMTRPWLPSTRRRSIAPGKRRL
jgi:hypothetical protein